MMGNVEGVAAAQRAGRLLAAAVALTVASAGWGQVTLDTSVARVETTLDDSGRTRRELVPVEEVVPGEELRYTITFHNDGETLVDAGRIVITNPIPQGTVYVPGSAGGQNASVEYSTDGEAFSASEPAGAPEADTGQDPADPAGAGGGVRSLRWIYEEDLPPGTFGEVYFHVRML